jgi:DNA-binding protein HU-beta
MKMTKPELVNKIAEKSNLSKKDAAAALTALTDVITEALKAEGKLAIPSLGTFEVKERAARTGHNPRTGEKVEITAKKVPVFKPAKALKDAVE